MSVCPKAAKPLTRCLQQAQKSRQSTASIRTFTTTCPRDNEVTTTETSTSPAIRFNPLTVSSPRGERVLSRNGINPIGSRRRRAALKSGDNLPFEQLPYQCFQEARKVLQSDREDKLQEIAKERARMARLKDQDASNLNGGERLKQIRLDSMSKRLEKLKILADINDPLIKKRFEDGDGDMNKPIYRYLADKKWRLFPRLIIMQRLTQLNIVPDVLSTFEPTAEVRMAFRRRNVQPGDFIDSRVSEVPPRLKVQVFDKGDRFVTIAVIDSDVPNVENDSFSSRCHYLATNIPISPTMTSLPLSKATDLQMILPWLPPFAQKGSPYHRLSVFVLQQQPGQELNAAELKDKVQRDGFSLKGFVDRHRLQPIGFDIFRSIWDEGTASVMERAGIEGADIEFRRKRIEAIKPKQKARGWEARHSGPKFKSLRR